MYIEIVGIPIINKLCCGVQKLFRKSMPSDGMVKLTNEEIKWLIRRVESGFFTVKQAAHVYRVTERRVQQLIKMHRERGSFQD